MKMIFLAVLVRKLPASNVIKLPKISNWPGVFNGTFRQSIFKEIYLTSSWQRYLQKQSSGGVL